MEKLIKNKIDITVLVTSIKDRETTIKTANYYSKICEEVILVDEELPHLSLSEISLLKKVGITYISYGEKNFKKPSNSGIEKRLFAAQHSKRNYVVHSNHDERYTFTGLLACVDELKKNKEIIFCGGQAIAIRKDDLNIYYTLTYKNLYKYKNLNKVEDRLYHHAKIYAPIAHYAVWRKNSYMDVTKKAISAHDLIPVKTVMDEVIFELAADLAGNSKAISDLYWIRNRINDPFLASQKERISGDYAFKIIENKLNVLFNNSKNIQVKIIIGYLYKNFPQIRTKTLIDKCIFFTKLMIRNIIKKKMKTRRIDGVDDIYTLLNDNKIKYEKNDLNNLLNSMSL